ncbi:DUF3140 domain-containing protein [Rhizosaccharibacter radicis]|uniref:DUF3140 domain-containing protein n=1 Tax=Rhizosaccharibacter radicis TaxID=2782605 RepID=A0ABT1W151_9PROT|nr:DUF3140 domain-containing protein [Acetobacteraceae bacterium KSS12]
MTKSADAEKDHDQIARDFREAVNMTPAALEKWLDSEESKSVGFVDGDNKKNSGGKESVGHKSGHRIVEIRRKKAADLTDDDYAHMKKVVGYVHRHLAQKPKGSDDIEHSRWRFSLMNWGHDPLKKH